MFQLAEILYLSAIAIQLYSIQCKLPLYHHKIVDDCNANGDDVIEMRTVRSCVECAAQCAAHAYCVATKMRRIGELVECRFLWGRPAFVNDNCTVLIKVMRK